MASPSSTDPVKLINAIDTRRKQAAAKALDVSLHELADMHAADELSIRPEFQRLFRWPLAKQSQFIESLILEMPVPPLFVIEIEENKWELIDGLQRVSSYLHLRGKLDAPHFDPPIKKGKGLVLEGCDILPELNGLSFNDLPAAIQIRLKRSFLRVEVVRRETDSRFRYYMFKRLNTGGEPLYPQEVRNCTIRLLGDRFNAFLQQMANNEPFRACIESLTAEKRQQMADVELVLRFFAFKNNFDAFRHDIDPFLTEYMERVTDQEGATPLSFDYTAERATFEKVFRVLSRCLGEWTCQRWLGRKFGGAFSMHHYEAFSLGLARMITKLNPSDASQMRRVRKTLIDAKKDHALKRLTEGGGKNSRGPYKQKIEFVEKKVRAALA